ncbi:MAG TPA: HlyD family efflux transporter periplasmic adaptor subunit [Hyphomicrobiaceae bacterium]|nr:HlyD family efflux transporter periplasmic adaptor subunit [Hyphomicrobiaceae bacterium]
MQAIDARRSADSRAAEVSSLARERAQAFEEFRAQAAAEKAEAEAIVATRSEGVRKALTREGYQTMVSPVDGVVNEIKVTTLGEVAQSGAPLMTIVPAGEELIAETLLLNRDVGFVAPGMPAVIKLEAYPFTRHGYLVGVVETISPDAVADEQRGLIFPARIKITGGNLRGVFQKNLPARQGSDSVSADDGGGGGRMCQSHGKDSRDVVAACGRPLPRSQSLYGAAALQILSPGMAAQVEVTTGRRRVISYVLSPVARATLEAGRER